mmetsp:Transcript_94572/g.276388  ORF Transcript_94572/g.276388 Transcript_94572/m.276388 type:complete len:215 (-) Transcript_94572:173-817(-)
MARHQREDRGSHPAAPKLHEGLPGPRAAGRMGMAGPPGSAANPSGERRRACASGAPAGSGSSAAGHSLPMAQRTMAEEPSHSRRPAAGRPNSGSWMRIRPVACSHVWRACLRSHSQSSGLPRKHNCWSWSVAAPYRLHIRPADSQRRAAPRLGRDLRGLPADRGSSAPAAPDSGPSAPAPPAPNGRPRRRHRPSPGRWRSGHRAPGPHAWTTCR